MKTTENIKQNNTFWKIDFFLHFAPGGYFYLIFLTFTSQKPPKKSQKRAPKKHLKKQERKKISKKERKN